MLAGSGIDVTHAAIRPQHLNQLVQRQRNAVVDFGIAGRRHRSRRDLRAQRPSSYRSTELGGYV